MSARDLARAAEDDDNSRHLDWMAHANCRGTPITLWFPTRGEVADGRRQRQALCGACPVRPECAAYAQHHRPVGIWAAGGPKTRQVPRHTCRAAGCTNPAGPGHPGGRDRYCPTCTAVGA